MNKTMIILIGIFLMLTGILLISYESIVNQETTKHNGFEEKLKEGEVLVQQSSKESSQKAAEIFSGLAAKKDIAPKYQFRIFYGLGKALEKNGETTKALQYYRKLNQSENLRKHEQEELSFSMGNILLGMDKEVEGISHLGTVLKISNKKLLRSNALTAIARYYNRHNDINRALKNYELAIEEDPENNIPRIELDELRKNLENPKVNEQTDGNSEKTSKQSTLRRGKGSLLSQAVYNHKRKRYKTSILLLQKALKRYRSSKNLETIYFYLGRNYQILGQGYLALEFYNKVLQNPSKALDQIASYQKGRIYFQQAKHEKASKAFQDVIENYPTSKYTTDAYKWRRESIRLLSLDEKDGSSKQDEGKESSNETTIDPPKKEISPNEGNETETESETEKPPEGSENVPVEDEDDGKSSRANVGFLQHTTSYNTAILF
ncbi:MAG: tetratricopeptide repeat protein [Spirochaetota bacterium]